MHSPHRNGRYLPIFLTIFYAFSIISVALATDKRGMKYMKKFLSCFLVTLMLLPLFSVYSAAGESVSSESQALLIALLKTMSSEEIVSIIADNSDLLDTSDIEELIRLLNIDLDSRPDKQTSQSSVSPSPTPETNIVYTILSYGKTGEEVKKLQRRLIELNYLDGTPSGKYDANTVLAVRECQKTLGLSVNGIANIETQQALFPSGAGIVVHDLDFKSVSRDPEKYKGQYFQFTGKVLQVLESEYSTYTLVNLRVATKDNYDNVVYVVYKRPKKAPRILEDDQVSIYGQCTGLYSYKSVLGQTITLPSFNADTITIKE